MAYLAIKGHQTRGEEVIEILEMLGGENMFQREGNNKYKFYYIDENKRIQITFDALIYTLFTLEEFLKKHSHKIGDKVCFPDDISTPFTINKMWWDENANELLCSFIEDDIEVPVVGIRAYKEESIDKTNKVVFDTNAQSCDIMNDIIKEEDMEEKGDKAKAPNLIGEDYSGKRFGYKIPQGYEFDCILNNEIIIKPIKPQYPKTYEECCKVVNASPYVSLVYDKFDGQTYSYDIDNLHIYENIRKLKIYRDAYWKIAGEEIGLNRPWEPDWKNPSERKYCIVNTEGNITKWVQKTTNKNLAFPTEEMRDAFYENFKEEIETCKEFL